MNDKQDQPFNHFELRYRHGVPVEVNDCGIPIYDTWLLMSSGDGRFAISDLETETPYEYQWRGKRKEDHGFSTWSDTKELQLGPDVKGSFVLKVE